ncbi:MAG: HEAT repeat domain-containing protein [Candidatus Heimdallarchaeota archaeon]|nr:HEAT repeat domain-containing protein [Candidatus Heimdallarchaeota archaeon]
MKVECPIQRNISLLKDKDPMVRRAAAEALGSMLTPRAVQPLTELLEIEKDVQVRRAIVLSLSLLGNSNSLPILLSILEKDSDLETRRNIAGGLRFFSNHIDSMKLINLILNESNKPIRDVLVGTFIYIQNKSQLSDLIKLFNKKDELEIKECLLEMIASFDNDHSKELLLECTSSGYPRELRLIAVRSMGKLDDVNLIPDIYDVYQNDEDFEIKETAEKILDELTALLGYSSIDQMVLECLRRREDLQ